MGKVFQIGMLDGNFAVSNLIETASPAVARSGLGSAFEKARDFSTVSADMGLGGNTPKIDNSFKM